MADTLVERVTGQASAGAVPVAINLVMSTDTMLGGEKAAEVAGYGPIPACVARQLVSEGFDLDSETTSTLMRLYTRPSDDRWSRWTPSRGALARHCRSSSPGATDDAGLPMSPPAVGFWPAEESALETELAAPINAA